MTGGERGRIDYRRFEDLPVWQVAIELAVAVFELSALGAFHRHPGLRDQIERAALSISNNIAEGYERGTHDEILTFLYYAKGSAGEVRSMLSVMARIAAFEDLQPEVEHLRSLVLDASRQLGSWIEPLKNSAAPGPRHTNDSTRAQKSQSQRAETHAAYLRRIAAGDPPRPCPDRDRDRDPPPS